MALMDFIKKQFIDIIQWTEETATACWPGATPWPTWKSRTAPA
jgi:membrane protease subunit (stomatin/prohibitin family)